MLREPFAPNAGKSPQERGGDARFWFSDWKLSGPGVRELPGRAFGPILFFQYTLTRRTLKLTVQLAPAEPGRKYPPVELRASGRTIARAAVDAYSSTATFRIPKWDDTRDTPIALHWQGASYAGTVRREGHPHYPQTGPGELGAVEHVVRGVQPRHIGDEHFEIRLSPSVR